MTLERNRKTVMSLKVQFVGGPAAGTHRDYPHINLALPSLYWSPSPAATEGAVYHRDARPPEAATGRWTYRWCGDPHHVRG
jgi:hypothetical protein